MKIETLFDIGDEIFYLKDSEIKKRRVIKIQVTKKEPVTEIIYTCHTGYPGLGDSFLGDEIDEHFSFKTKEDLIQYLTQKTVL